MIQALVDAGVLNPEFALPRKRCDGSLGYYGILNKQGEKLNTHDEPCISLLSELGFEDGDTIRIIAVGCCA